MSYTGTVLWSGNHYHHGEQVSGSKIRREPDGKVCLFDDEENYVQGLGDLTRYDWVEVDPDSIEVI